MFTCPAFFYVIH